MAIPSSGQVSLNTVKTEFGDPNSDGQYKLSEYYRDGDNDPIPNSQTSVPASGAISIGNFRGTSSDPTVYYIQEGAGSTKSFIQTSDSQDEDAPASATAQIGYKVVQSGTSIQIYAWDVQNSDSDDSHYYSTSGTQTNFSGYTSSSNSLLIFSVNTGVTSGYSAYYGLSLVSGADIATYYSQYGMAGMTTSTSGNAVSTTPQGMRIGYLVIAPIGDSMQKSGVTRITFTLVKSSSPTYTAQFVMDLYAQAESEESDCPQCCVHTDMLVHTPNGETHISQLHIGSQVYSYNFETGEKVIDTITRKRFVRRDNEVKVNNLVMTEDHPVYLQDGRLASFNPEGTLNSYNMVVDQLVVGDNMMTANGELQEINTIEILEGTQPNYTLYTRNGNFYASPQGDNSILVDSVIQELI